MALSDIITKIKKDAEGEAKRIKDGARNEATTILERAKARAKEVARVGSEDATRAGSKARGRVVASATHEAKFAVQAFRVSFIDRAFGEVEKKLVAMPKDAYLSFVTKRAQTLPEKKGALTVSSERKEETLEALKGAGIDTKEAHERALLGGFVFETQSAVYDHSLRSVVLRAKEELAGDVARELFKS